MLNIKKAFVLVLSIEFPHNALANCEGNVDSVDSHHTNGVNAS
ncbi:MAG: hypothetical protein OXC07_07920 [Kistimonas sp.]|nr:hypothetical protein [Kistimonas sp.]